jgi:hypothetical protein
MIEDLEGFDLTDLVELEEGLEDEPENCSLTERCILGDGHPGECATD